MKRPLINEMLLLGIGNIISNFIVLIKNHKTDRDIFARIKYEISFYYRSK